MAKINNAFQSYPPFIFGEALNENDEFVLSTRYPRFLARVSFEDSYIAAFPHGGGFVANDKGQWVFKGNGVWLSEFVFFDKGIDPYDSAFMEILTNTCNAALDTMAQIEIQTGTF